MGLLPSVCSCNSNTACNADDDDDGDCDDDDDEVLGEFVVHPPTAGR